MTHHRYYTLQLQPMKALEVFDILTDMIIQITQNLDLV